LRGRERGAEKWESTIPALWLDIVGFVFALLLIGNSSSRALLPFCAGAVIALIGGVVAGLSLKNKKLSASPVQENLGTITRDRITLALIPSWFVLMFLIGVFLTYTREIIAAIEPGGTSLITSLSSSNLGILAVLAVIAGGVLLGFAQSGLGTLSDRFGRTRLIVLGQVSILGLLLVLVGLLYFHFSAWISLPLALLFCAGLLAFTPAALAELADVAPESGRGSAMGLYPITVGAGSVFGPLAGGALISSYGVSTGLTFIFEFGAAIMMILLAYEGYYLTQR